jgi:hypothetical protein
VNGGAQWTGLDGFPRDWPEALEPAIRGLPGGAELSAQTIAHYAKRLTIAADLGRRMEKPAGRNASRGETDKSLDLLHDQCEKLVATIAGLKRPASEALAREGASLFVLQSMLAETQQAARHCHSYTDAPEVAKSRPPKVEARHVTHEAARIYAEIVGRSPTVTKNPVSNKVSGPWISFLASTFAALYIDASAEAQAAAREKRAAR